MRFSKRTDKQPAPYFVGRRDVIAGIEDTVDKMRQLIASREVVDKVDIPTNLSTEFTWLVRGAPGAGKSSLQHHLQQRWTKRANSPISILLEPTILDDEDELTKVIANAIRSDGAADLGRIQTLELAGGLKIPGIGVSVKNTETRSLDSLTLRDLWRLYDRSVVDYIRRHLSMNYRHEISELRPVVLLIDEIQSLTVQGEKLLSRIHLGRHGLPIMAVLAGLAWSRSRLKDAGISRMSSGHVRTLGPLTEAEATGAVHLLLEDYEIEGFRDAVVARKIALWSDGWPQHLHNYMCVLAAELVNRKGDLAAVDENRIREAGDRVRKDYYMERLDDSPITACINLLADTAELIGSDGCDESVILGLLRRRPWHDERDPADSMPQDMKPQAFIGEMIRAGIIHREKRRITIPIPSFRQYLIDSSLSG